MDFTVKIKDTREMIKSWRKQELSIGFVPTMGYLHDGHRSLIEKARRENDKVVVSIFVNPIQFGPNEDFAKYPRDMERDMKVCTEAGADLVFAPEDTEMYPVRNLAYMDIESLGDRLCGSKRPGHFRGVCTVVAKLFNIIMPDRTYFGQKDAQQLAIISRMVRDLDFPTEIVPCPIIREPDGVAMSSRNSYLSTEERAAAPVIQKSLNMAYEALLKGERDAEKIKNMISEIILSEPHARIDYVDVADAFTLEAVEAVKGSVLVAVAVYMGRTRLIDNISFKEAGI